MKLSEISEGVAGPKNCWPGYRKVGTKPGTGKNAGKRVNDCEKIKEDVDVVDQGEYDREGDMAMGQLKTAADAANELRSILDSDENLPEWVQSKITKAVDYLDTARDYMKSKEQGVAEASLRQLAKTTLRKLDPTIKGRLKDRADDEFDFGLEKDNDGDWMSGAPGSAHMKHAAHLRRIAKGENPFQDKLGVAETSDYFRRREREEAIISGQKPARKKQPAQTSDYARRREQEKKAEKGVAESRRDPRDWDEGNREPVNNFAIYINRKKWKVLPGPEGAYADSPQEFRAYAKLKDMCRRKSQETGKQWEVVKTGERPSQDKRGVAEGSNSLPSYLRGESRFVKSAYKTLIKYGFIPDDEDERTSQMGSFKHAKGHMADITWEGNIKLLIKQPNGKYMRLYLDDATEMPKVAAQLQLSPVSTEQGVAEADPQHSHQYSKTMKHAKNPTVQQRIAAHDIKPGVAGYKDRVDLLKDLERTGKLKKEQDVKEVAPKGWEGTVKAMKKHDEIDNPWALAWHMKNKGYTSHKK